MNFEFLYNCRNNRNATFFFGFRKFCSVRNNETTIRVTNINSKKRANSISALDSSML